MVQHYSHDEELHGLSDNSTLANPNITYSSSIDDDGARAGLLAEQSAATRLEGLLTRLARNLLPLGQRGRGYSKYSIRSKRQRTRLRPTHLRRIVVLLLAFFTTVVFLQAIFLPSYTSPPPHYVELQNRAYESDISGRANPDNQKVFIAASIFDPNTDLVTGAWAESVLGLIDILGPENVHLSIYENDAGQEAEFALEDFALKVPCDHTIKFEKHLTPNKVPHIRLGDGSNRVKRIAYLSEVRNQALKPLENSLIRYDKLLFINDVIFDPLDAAQLLFSTHMNADGKAEYRAACAVDFINPFKYYDTFATRDYEGYGIGLPFYPWFTSVGQGISRGDVLAGSDAVRVRSCWGGMVAFDAKYFQPTSSSTKVPPTAGSEGPGNFTPPYKFRAEDDLFWDASECCLIHADIQSPDLSKAGIYMNPYVRVAYDKGTLSWLGFARRLEKLYSPVHYFISKIVGMPWYNPRRAERAWETVEERVWIDDRQMEHGGAFFNVERTATHSGFCGRRALQVLKKDLNSEGKNWEFLPVPD